MMQEPGDGESVSLETGSAPSPGARPPDSLLGSAAASHPTLIYVNLLSERPVMGIPAKTSLQTTLTQITVGTMPQAGYQA